MLSVIVITYVKKRDDRYQMREEWASVAVGANVLRLLNGPAAAQYWALASIILGRERLFWNLSFSFSKHFS
jgi:hypothetical protein